MNIDCRRTATLLMQAADGDLTAEQAQWLEGHLPACAACREAQERFARVDRELLEYGEWKELHGAGTPAAKGGAPSGPRRHLIHWMPAAAASIAATVLLGVALLHYTPPAAEVPSLLEAQRFVPIPYVPPLDPYEGARVMRMEVPVAALMAAGYKVQGDDPTAIVQADVLVGEDGRAHAVRLVAGASLN